MIWKKIDQYAKRYHMFDGTGLVVIGLSGGADSICLARYLIHLRDQGGPGIRAVHINHMLRGQEADRDQDFVEDFCRQWELPLDVFREDVQSLSRTSGASLEEAGRRVRYARFGDVLNRSCLPGKGTIALAHHADDQAETILFRMIRGTGPRGLVGMQPVRGALVRPFLATRKKEILTILARLGQSYVTDSSNLTRDCSRNRIRHDLLPVMEEMNPHAVDHLCSLASQEKDLLDYTGPQMQSLFDQLVISLPDGYRIRAQKLLALDAWPRREMARQVLFAAAASEKDIGSVQVDQLLSLAEGAAGRQVDFPYGVQGLRTEEEVLLTRKGREEARPRKKEDQADFTEISLTLPPYREGETFRLSAGRDREFVFRYEDYRGTSIPKKDCEKYFDYDTINMPLSIRTRREGDYLVMDSAGRHKRLSRYFIDSQVPAAKRAKQVLLAEGSHILWIPGGRISEAFRITEKTRRMLIVQLK